jgi:hypothetical protein
MTIHKKEKDAQSTESAEEEQEIRLLGQIRGTVSIELKSNASIFS